MVGSGQTRDGRTARFEILDLENTASKCKAVPDFPMAIHGATAGLGINGMPMVGGGFNGSFYSADCYALDLSWHSLPALKNQFVVFVASLRC